jgi:hypothetical protein
MPKVLSESYASHAASFVIAAQGGSVVELPLRRNAAHIRLTVIGATLRQDAQGEALVVTLPHGDGYQKAQVNLRW